jgi:CRISPR-associated exonuclease Cas4
MLNADVRLIPLSALQHYAFCPRQCALIHNEQVWAENYFTAHGQLLHQRVDSGDPETRKGIRYERGIVVNAPLLGLTGKLDLLEKEIDTGKLMPVEYKRGRPKKTDCDSVQLCAQVLCLEEMTGQRITQGALWYWQTRKREPVMISETLRKRTLGLIRAINDLFTDGGTPKAIYGKHCKACSLLDICNPLLSQRDPSINYMKSIFNFNTDDLGNGE